MQSFEQLAELYIAIVVIKYLYTNFGVKKEGLTTKKGLAEKKVKLKWMHGQGLLLIGLKFWL